uniref:Protein FAF-like, chloroplastic n=1 Tax=Noccaea caerulescens TaxID=107243 RepID=A0A1J3FXP7_NOCCA
MMACGLSKSLGFSSSLKKQQGIVTILGGADCDIPSNTLSAPSLRRTFSADLSSKNWVTQNGFSLMKRISSSEKLRAFVTDSLSSGDEETGDAEAEDGSRSGVDIWAQIQQDKNKKKKEEEIEPGQSDVWGSILSDKKKTESSNDTVPPPYVHPLMKRASSLSEKSLEICTESLGSETGCEGFSSYASSETGDAEIEKEISTQEEMSLVLIVTETKKEEETEVVAEAEVEQESITVPVHTTCNELPRGSFPPPIRSLSSQSGSSLHMKTRRDNGRLVLEAVSMPSHNNFSAKRQDGRLLLTFAEISNELDIASDKEDEIESEAQWFDEEEEVEEEEEEEEEEPNEFAYKPNGVLYKLAQKHSGPITVHRLAHKPITVPKRNSVWPATEEFKTKSDKSTPVVHSLPPRPRVAQLARSTKPPSTVDDTVGAACFNTCDYYWKPTNAEAFGPNAKTQFQGQNLVHKSIGVGHDGWMINGCKERRRSLLSVEPFCIATS